MEEDDFAILAYLEQQEEMEKNKKPDESVEKKERFDTEEEDVVTVDLKRLPINVILVEYNEDGGSLKALIGEAYGKGTAVNAYWYSNSAKLVDYKKYSTLVNGAFVLDAPCVVIVREDYFIENFENILNLFSVEAKYIYVILQSKLPDAVRKLNRLKGPLTEVITQVFFTQVRDKVIGPEKEQDEIIEEEEIPKDNDYIEQKE